MSTKISGSKYAAMYGPTTGDKVRLADTSLVIEVEKDYTTYGDEVKFGGGKTIRDGMGQSVKTCSKDGDLLAKEVDFFSIGTNDLTQYTLAIDRQNAKLDNIYDSHHEAVLRMIQMVIDNAHKEGILAGICGELGSDTTFTERFIQMGIDELSVSPTFVLPVRKIVRELD